MREFAYGEIVVTKDSTDTKVYTFERLEIKEYSLIECLNEIGYFGWQLVGEIEGKIIVMIQDKG